MIKKLVRKNIETLKPYSCARMEYSGDGLFMDANENPFQSVKIGLKIDLNRYPDPYATDLRKSLSNYLRVSAKNIFVSSGSDEIIDLLMRIFLNENDEIVIFEPTYGMYRASAETANAKVKVCLLNADFQIDFRALPQCISKKTKMIFICRPNNPTGNLISEDDVISVCKMFDGIVVVDEAYIEFSSAKSVSRLSPLIQNLVVLRTFSKAWGLAGIRVGYAITNAEIISYLNKVKLPYNVSAVSQYIATLALNRPNQMIRLRDKIVSEREKLKNILEKMGFKVFPSEANFLLIKSKYSDKIFEKLIEKYRIIVRRFKNKPLVEDCFRITIGTPRQNDLLLKSIKKIVYGTN
ncbi:MAG: histidinol-phosphate transaminase [Candidatus Gracilibacteria bacterium]|jgi:histidinol-phosphate aminotransferase